MQTVRAVLEALAAQLGMSEGRWRVEFVFENGRLREWFRHEERPPLAALEPRADAAP